MRDRRQVLTAGVVAAGGLVTPAAAGDAAGSSVAERFAATLNAHDIAAFAALFDDGYVNHQRSAAAPAPAGKTAKEATVALFGARLAGMPDLAVTIDGVVADARRVAASFNYTGTHTAPYLGVPATGRRLSFSSCDIFELRDGRIVEHWGMGDIAGILAQLRA